MQTYFRLSWGHLSSAYNPIIVPCLINDSHQHFVLLCENIRTYLIVITVFHRQGKGIIPQPILNIRAGR